MTIPVSASFSTKDRLNTPEPEPTKAEVLAEALRIVRGQTMMLAQKKHLVALAEAHTEAASHLRVALVQALPSDDQIIIGHVRDALALLETNHA